MICGSCNRLCGCSSWATSINARWTTGSATAARKRAASNCCAFAKSSGRSPRVPGKAKSALVAMDWVEPAERVGDRQHAARQTRQPFEVLPGARGKAVVPNAVGRTGAAQRVVYRCRGQRAGRFEEGVPGLQPRSCAMLGDRGYPAAAFHRHQHRIQRQERWIRQRKDKLPIGWRTGRDRYHDRGVAEINPDLRFRRPFPAERVEQRRGQRAATRGVYHQVGRQDLGAS